MARIKRRPLIRLWMAVLIPKRKIMAAMNCKDKRNFVENSILSPQKLNKAIAVMGNQKLGGILSSSDDTTKAARIPIPPPFGTSPVWELRLFGLSSRPRALPQRDISQAPAPPKTKQIIYKTILSTDYTDFRRLRTIYHPLIFQGPRSEINQEANL